MLDQTQLDQTQSGKAPNFAPEEDELRACVLFGCFLKTWKYSVPEVLKTPERRLQFVYLLAIFDTWWGQVTKLRPLQMAFQTNAGTLYCTRSYCGGDLRNISATRNVILREYFFRPIFPDGITRFPSKTFNDASDNSLRNGSPGARVCVLNLSMHRDSVNPERYIRFFFNIPSLWLQR